MSDSSKRTEILSRLSIQEHGKRDNSYTSHNGVDDLDTETHR